MWKLGKNKILPLSKFKLFLCYHIENMAISSVLAQSEVPRFTACQPLQMFTQLSKHVFKVEYLCSNPKTPQCSVTVYILITISATTKSPAPLVPSFISFPSWDRGTIL